MGRIAKWVELGEPTGRIGPVAETSFIRLHF